MRLANITLMLVVFGLWTANIAAQELTPRTFWPAPKGTKVLVMGYSYATGDIFFDTSVPIEGADSTINGAVAAYTQTLNLFGRTANFLATVPYAFGTSQGLVAGEPGRRDFSAFGDMSLNLNINLLGAPSMNWEEFTAFRANPPPIVGFGVKVVAPTGQYFPERLVNVGANRWATRFKLGAAFPIRSSWLLEVSASTWLFGDDDDFVMGKKEQAPIYALETNLIKRIRPGLWASVDVTYFTGGQQTIGGGPLRDRQRNVKLGGTMVIPFLKRHAIKLGYANGIITRFGNDFDQFLLSYSVVL